jgi:hypothetical protein
MEFMQSNLKQPKLLLIPYEDAWPMTADFGDKARSFDRELPPCLRASVVDWLLTSSFPRLPFEVFSSQIESYGHLSLHVEDRI